MLYREAAERWEAYGSVVERGYALLGLGRCGDAKALGEGQAIFAGLGASPVVAQRPRSAAGVGAGGRRALLGLRQLGRRERRAVQDVALRHLDLVETVRVHDLAQDDDAGDDDRCAPGLDARHA